LRTHRATDVNNYTGYGWTGHDWTNYVNPDKSIKDAAEQLRVYQNRDHLNTVHDLIAKYSGLSNDDPKLANYFKLITNRTGIKEGDFAQTQDPNWLAKLVSAISVNESGSQKYGNAEVVVHIIAEPGSSPIVGGASLFTITSPGTIPR